MDRNPVHSSQVRVSRSFMSFAHGGQQPNVHAPIGSLDTFYTMFPNLPSFTPDKNLLINLGKQGGPMDANVVYKGGEAPTNPHIPSGFTFLGQFLDHNITFDSVSKLPVMADQKPFNVSNNTFNFRTGRVDLAHVYGAGPSSNDFHFYDIRPDHDGKFWIDPSADFDVPRNPQGTAIIPDPRNDNNIFIIQLHLLMMKFHNKVVDHLKAQNKVDILNLFQQAQQIVQWHYQWIVLHDWLERIIEPSTLKDIRANGLKYYTWDKTKGPQIPIEFSIACYRLHPLLKENYKVNDVFTSTQDPNLPVGVGKLFHFRTPFVPLKKEMIINWKYFVGADATNLANVFNGAISDTFLNIPGPMDNPLQWPDDIPTQQALRSIAVRNFLRAWSFGLTSGQDLAQRLGLTPLTNDQLGLPGKEWGGKAPLWYYAMKEGYIENKGLYLGQVSSRIVGEVLTGLVQGDVNSYLNAAHPGWTPTLPSAKKGDFTLEDLVNFTLGTTN